MNINYFSLAGWLGMILLVLSYAMISFKKLKTKSRSKIYHFLNLFGATGILANAIYTRLFPVIVLNIIWMGISIFSLVKIFSVKPVYKELG